MVFIKLKIVFKCYTPKIQVKVALKCGKGFKCHFFNKKSRAHEKYAKDLLDMKSSNNW